MLVSLDWFAPIDRYYSNNYYPAEVIEDWRAIIFEGEGCFVLVVGLTPLLTVLILLYDDNPVVPVLGELE